MYLLNDLHGDADNRVPKPPKSAATITPPPPPHLYIVYILSSLPSAFHCLLSAKSLDTFEKCVFSSFHPDFVQALPLLCVPEMLIPQWHFCMLPFIWKWFCLFYFLILFKSELVNI